MKITRLTLVWIVLFLLPATLASARPNFVFIFADDLGWGDSTWRILYVLPQGQCMELDNLADRYPDEVKRFSKILREFKASIPQGVPNSDSGSNVYPMPTGGRASVKNPSEAER